MAGLACKVRDNAKKLKELCASVAALAASLLSLEGKVDAQKQTVYKLSDRVVGVSNREWHDTKPTVAISASTTAVGRDYRICHDFSLTPDTATTVASLTLNDTNNTAGEMDVQVLDTIITAPAGGVWIQWIGGSEGYWAAEIGLCCGPLQLAVELAYVEAQASSFTVGPIFIPEGQHALRVWNIDSGGTNSSHTAQYSLDNTTFATAIPAGVELNLSKRLVEKLKIGVCDPIPEGWSCDEPNTECDAGIIDPLPTEPSGLSEEDVLGLIPPPVVVPDQEICAGPFTGATNQSSWWAGWSPVRTANQATETRIDWAVEHSAIQSPSCVTDLSFTYELGSWYIRVRRARVYIWVDLEIVIGGLTVQTIQNFAYYYGDELDDTNPDVIKPVPIDLKGNLQSLFGDRLNVPAGVAVELRTRVRDNVNGAQASAYVRHIDGLRSGVVWTMLPRNLVIGRVV